MIRVRRHGDVTQLVMARAVFGRPLYVVCAYFIDGLLLDNGPPAVGADFRRALTQLEVRQAVLTHGHEDHAGGSSALSTKGIVPLAHPLAIPLLADPPRQQIYRRVVWGRHLPSLADPVGAELATTRYHFRVLHTPGHSVDHICLFEERRGWLFSGDLFLSPFVKVMRTDENPHQIIASLRKVLALPVGTLFCSGGKVIADGKDALQRKLDFWERLRDQARALQARGRSAGEIRRQLLGPEGTFRLITFGHFSKQNLIDALLAEDRPGAEPALASPG